MSENNPYASQEFLEEFYNVKREAKPRPPFQSIALDESNVLKCQIYELRKNIEELTKQVNDCMKQLGFLQKNKKTDEKEECFQISKTDFWNAVTDARMNCTHEFRYYWVIAGEIEEKLFKNKI